MPPRNKAEKSGLTLPGYKYLGPFNSLFSGKPVNKADEAARRHDFGYSDLLKEGKNPYLYFNEHDVNLINDLRDDTSFGGILARSVFQVKQAIAPALAGTSKGTPTRAGTDRAQKRKLYFARSNKKGGAKQAKMDNSISDNNTIDENPEQPVEAVGDARAGSGGTGSMGGGGKGGSGVGYSTGGWTGGTIFSDGIVITKNTRQFLCDIKNSHLYKSVSISGGTNGAPQFAYTTPWSYFNFNQYSAHFSPNDWQHFVNEYERFRPIHMRVRVYNLQIKQIVTDSANNSTLYNNDLTAGMHIFCDGSHAYPYVQHPWDENTMPENPTDIWKLPQYGYIAAPLFTVNDQESNEVEKDILRSCPLYILENSDHEVLRTGEATEFTYNFGDCEFVENNITFQMPQNMYNPLVRSRRAFIHDTSQSGVTGIGRQNSALRQSAWYAGPGIKNLAHAQNITDLQLGPIYTKVDNGATGDTVYRATYSSGPAQGSLHPTRSEQNLSYYTDDDLNNTTYLQDSTHITFTRDYDIWKMSTPTTSNAVNEWWMLPNQAWDSAPISRYHPIWIKVPRVNRRTMIDTPDGTVPLEHPPGTIFVKLAKIPVPGTGDSYLNIYVTGQVSCEIAWEVKKRGTKNWRPEYAHAAQLMDPRSYTFDSNGKYRTAQTNPDAMQTRIGHLKVL